MNVKRLDRKLARYAKTGNYEKAEKAIHKFFGNMDMTTYNRMINLETKKSFVENILSVYKYNRPYSVLLIGFMRYAKDKRYEDAVKWLNKNGIFLKDDSGKLKTIYIKGYYAWLTGASDKELQEIGQELEEEVFTTPWEIAGPESNNCWMLENLKFEYWWCYIAPLITGVLPMRYSWHDPDELTHDWDDFNVLLLKTEWPEVEAILTFIQSHEDGTYPKKF